jgi:uncharacterized Fe-S cluster protein YjdI
MSNKVTKAELSEFKKDKDNVKEFSNGEVTVYWRANLCIHSANCLMGMPRVFNTKRKPWINVTGADSKEIMKTVDSCPSRALTYLKSTSFTLRKKRKAKLKAPKFAKVQILKNGPALVTGNFIIRDSNKKKIKISSPVAALCRCGASRKKPFCDGSHLSIGFTD